MSKNITEFKKFRDKRYNPEEKINEMVDATSDGWRVTFDVDVPKTLINAYVKKVKDSTNTDIRESIPDKMLAEKLVYYVLENFITIENLPLDIVVSSDKTQVQTQVQEEPQIQEEPQLQVEPQEDMQVQVSEPGTQETIQAQPQAQQTAQEIPAQEI